MELARQEPDRWCVLDATLTVEEISDIIWKHVGTLLASHSEGYALELDSGLPLWAQNANNADNL